MGASARLIFRSIKQLLSAPMALRHYECNGLSDIEHLDRRMSSESVCETLLLCFRRSIWHIQLYEYSGLSAKTAPRICLTTDELTTDKAPHGAQPSRAKRGRRRRRPPPKAACAEGALRRRRPRASRGLQALRGLQTKARGDQARSEEAPAESNADSCFSGFVGTARPGFPGKAWERRVLF